MGTDARATGSGWAKTIAVGVVGGVAAGVLLLAVITASTSTPTAQADAPALDESQTVALETVSAKFAQAPTKADRLPAHLLDSGVEKFVPETARALGTARNANYWLVANDQGDVCLALATLDGWGAATCQPTDYVLKNGLAVQLIDTEKGDGGTRAVFVPQDYAVTAFSEVLTPVGDQLLVGPADVASEEVTLKSTDGSTVVIDELQAVTQ
jgi:hypothetical protein